MHTKYQTISSKPCYAMVFGICLLSLVQTTPVEAQTVQLPTFGGFSFSGSVMVPDGGTLQAGSVKRYAEGSVSKGVPGLGGIPGINRGFQNRAIGRETGSSGLTIKPTILVMSELEEDHLAAAGYEPDGRQQGLADSVVAKAAFLTRNVGRNNNSTRAESGSDDSGIR